MTNRARLVTVLTVAAALLSGTGCNKLRARDQLNKGVQAYKAGNYEQAIEHFKNAVDYDKDLRTAKLYLATAYREQYVPNVFTPENDNNANRAIEEYKEVLTEDPKDVNSLKGIATLYMNMNKIDESIDYFRKAIAVDPNDPDAYYSVGVIDWNAAYKDTGARKAKAGLPNVEAPMKTKQDLKLCDEIKAADEPRVDDGLKMMEIAMQKRQDFDDAMLYTNLLYLRKADMSCDDPAAAEQDRKLSDEYTTKAMAARKKKYEEAAKKTNGGIQTDGQQ